MKNKFDILSYCIGIFIGTGIWVFASNVIPNSRYNINKNAIEACEKNLPRNQTCVITAVPK